MTYTIATSGTSCWQCGQPAQREKHGYGACKRHLLPTKDQRKAQPASSDPEVKRPALTVVSKTTSKEHKAPPADGSPKQCPTCRKFFMSVAQREHHEAIRHKAAKRYAREFFHHPADWHRVFTPSVRQACAEARAKDEAEKIRGGEYS